MSEEPPPGADAVRLRQSLLNDGDVCQMRMAYGLDTSLPRRPRQAPVIGTGYHAGLEAYYRGSRDIADLVAAGVEAIEAEDQDGEVIWDTSKDDAIATMSTMLTSYVEGGRGWDPGRFDVLAVEWDFAEPFEDGALATGTIDLVLLDKANGWHLLVDHKTARKPWKRGKESARNTNQVPWYLHWWTVTRPTPPAGVRFFFDVMTYDCAFERRESVATATHRARVLRKASLVHELLAKGGPFMPNTQHYLCSPQWCDWWDLCPWGAHYNYDPEIEQPVQFGGQP